MYTDERNILDVKGQSLIHALAPLFTIHRELKSKSVWQREDMSKFKRKCMLANLSISLATYYILTRYNRAFTTKEPTK